MKNIIPQVFLVHIKNPSPRSESGENQSIRAVYLQVTWSQRNLVGRSSHNSTQPGDRHNYFLMEFTGFCTLNLQAVMMSSLFASDTKENHNLSCALYPILTLQPCPLPVVKTKYVFRYCQMSLWGEIVFN